MLLFIILNLFIGAIGGINQTSLRKLLIFSSINHIGWIISSILFNESIWILYFSIYLILNICVILLFNINQSYYLSQIGLFTIKSYFLKLYFLICVLSLGGLPPFLGFFPKWVLLEVIILEHFNFLVTFIILIRLITLRFYLYIRINSIILNSYSANWHNLSYLKSNINYVLFYLLLTVSIFGLFVLAPLYYFNI